MIILKIYIAKIYDILENETSIARHLAIRKFHYHFSSVLHNLVNLVKSVFRQKSKLHSTIIDDPIGCGLSIYFVF